MENIPNLSYISNGKIVVNQLDNRRSGACPLTVPLNYDKIDFQKYSSYFQPQGNLSNVKIVGSTYTQRGCAYAGHQKCTFCSIEQMNLWRSPELFEQDLYNLITKYNVDHVRIADADFTISIKHISKIADAANRVFEKTGYRPVFHCFARADEINHEKARILNELNAVSLMVGYESGSDKMLKAMNKHITKEENFQATRLLKDYGIEVINGGLVLGCEGENEETLSETIEFLHELKRINNTRTMMATPLIPLPGSPCFDRLLQKLLLVSPLKFQELNNADEFDLVELIELWNYYFCNVSLSRIIEVCEQVEKMFSIGIRLIDMKREMHVTHNRKIAI